MKLIRFLLEGRQAYGILSGDEVLELNAGYAQLNPSSVKHHLSDVVLLAPCAPSKVVAVGLNYRDHAQELGMAVPENPIIFLKPPTSIIGPDADIIIPRMSRQVDYEAELGVVIKKRARRLAPEAVKEYILGYTCANDVTARDLQKTDGQWTRAKSFDTFCPVGPWIETDISPDNLLIESYLNGEQRQSSRTSQFIFPVDFLVSFISHIMTLEPGDLIITGTPPGIGTMRSGDRIEIRIEGIGRLENSVRVET